ncbi:acyltransferase [uncultured Dokdonia sp.]|uniref:acyltransferase n=1 Tax=uncultured Dokdonia sp. TaxID=575653 RepID=UPI002624FE76|nr:acyltransferase [uncultured Dokdonia sp.]
MMIKLYYGLTTLLSRFKCIVKGVKLGNGVLFKGLPSIIKKTSAIIEVGSNTLLNSSNYGYHINMHSSCKLLADRNDAKISIGSNCRIHGTCIHAYNSITIGNNVLIAANTQIIDGNGHQLSFNNTADRIHTTDMGKPIIIEDNVWIGANCFILGGVTIGEGAVISANSVVHKDIKRNTIVGGNPAKLIKDAN